jgi:hypothetical protein
MEKKKEDLTFFTEFLKRNTANWAKDQGFTGREGSNNDLSSKATKIRDLLIPTKDRKALSSILSILLEEDIELPDFYTKNTVILRPMVVVVPLTNANNHNYPIDSPALMTSKTMGIKVDGTMGNNMTHTRGSIRPATEDEIDFLVNNKKVMKNLGY